MAETPEDVFICLDRWTVRDLSKCACNSFTRWLHLILHPFVPPSCPCSQLPSPIFPICLSIYIISN